MKCKWQKIWFEIKTKKKKYKYKVYEIFVKEDQELVINVNI